MFLCTCLDYENSLAVENYYSISPSKGHAFSNNVLAKISPGIIMLKPVLEF